MEYYITIESRCNYDLEFRLKMMCNSDVPAVPSTELFDVIPCIEPIGSASMNFAALTRVGDDELHDVL